MNSKEFYQRIKKAKIKGNQINALFRVLVKKETAYSVSKKTGFAQSQLSRQRKKLERELCNCCKQFKSRE